MLPFLHILWLMLPSVRYLFHPKGIPLGRRMLDSRLLSHGVPFLFSHLDSYSNNSMPYHSSFMPATSASAGVGRIRGIWYLVLASR